MTKLFKSNWEETRKVLMDGPSKKPSTMTTVNVMINSGRWETVALDDYETLGFLATFFPKEILKLILTEAYYKQFVEVSKKLRDKVF